MSAKCNSKETVWITFILRKEHHMDIVAGYSYTSMELWWFTNCSGCNRQQFEIMS